MPRARANGIDIEYEGIGDPNDAPLLLVMGLGAQLITWDDEFCVQLAASAMTIVTPASPLTSMRRARRTWRPR